MPINQRTQYSYYSRNLVSGRAGSEAKVTALALPLKAATCLPEFILRVLLLGSNYLIGLIQKVQN